MGEDAPDPIIAPKAHGENFELDAGETLNVSGSDIDIEATDTGKNTVNVKDSGETLTAVGRSSETQVQKNAGGKISGVTFKNTEAPYSREYSGLNRHINVDSSEKGNDTTLNVTDGTRNATLTGDAGDTINYTSPNKTDAVVKSTTNGYSVGIEGRKEPIVTAVGEGNGNFPNLSINGEKISPALLKAAMGGIAIPSHPDNAFGKVTTKQYVGENLVATQVACVNKSASVGDDGMCR